MNKILKKESAVTTSNTLLLSVNVQKNYGKLELTDEGKKSFYVVSR